MSRRSQRRSGFTLVELLVAVAITAMLTAAMLVVTSGVLRLWRRTQDRFTTQAQAELALDFIERDFQAAVFRADGRTWLAVDLIDSSEALTNHGWRVDALMKPAGGHSPAPGGGTSVADARFGRSGAWLRLIATNVEAKNAQNPGGSLPAAIAYQIIRRPVSGSFGAGNRAVIRYALFRSAVAADATFAAGLDVLADGYRSTSAAPPAARSPRSLTNPSGSDALGTNVVDVGVWLYARDGPAGLTRIFPSNEADSSHTAKQHGEFPVVADVMVRVLTDEGAILLRELEAARGTVSRPGGVESDAAWWWSVVEANSHVYARRVEIRRNP